MVVADGETEDGFAIGLVEQVILFQVGREEITGTEGGGHPKVAVVVEREALDSIVRQSAVLVVVVMEGAILVALEDAVVVGANPETAITGRAFHVGDGVGGDVHLRESAVGTFHPEAIAVGANPLVASVIDQERGDVAALLGMIGLMFSIIAPAQTR